MNLRAGLFYQDGDHADNTFLQLSSARFLSNGVERPNSKGKWSALKPWWGLKAIQGQQALHLYFHNFISLQCTPQNSELFQTQILPESVGGKGKLVRIEDAKVSGPQEAKDTANHPLVEPSVQAKSLQRIPQPASVGPASSGQSTEKEEGTILAPRGPNNTPLVQQGRILYCGLPCRGYHKLNQPGGKWRLFSAQGRQETSRRIPLFQSIP